MRKSEVPWHFTRRGGDIVELKMVVDSTAKLGHECPHGCLRAQLYMGDDGLRCPTCNTVFVPEDAKAASKPKKAAKE